MHFPSAYGDQICSFATQSAVRQHDDVSFNVLCARTQQAATHTKSFIIRMGREHQPGASGKLCRLERY